MARDFAQLDMKGPSDRGMVMTITDLATGLAQTDDDGTPWTITLQGRHSDTFKRVLKGVNEARAKLRAANQPAASDDTNRENIDFLIACTVDWTISEMDGQPFPCTPGNIRQLWNDPRFPWLNEMAIGFVTRDANFLAPPAPRGRKSGDSPGTISSSINPSPETEPARSG